ncbi:MAG: hypothetical protein O3A10_05685 [Chloroflexi bacterium]|nr:hypothetical protein [Chloroflexota bacterium]
MITNKFTAYGLAVAVAFAAAVVLLFASAPLGVSADKGTTADAAATIDNATAGNAVTIKGTHVSGKEACDNGTFAVTSALGGTAATPVDAACATLTTTIATLGIAADKTLTVVATKGFPDAGSLLIDNDGNGDTSTGALEIVDYTGKTATSFTGVTRARAGTTALVPAVGADIWPAVYSQITIGAVAQGATLINIADASGFVFGGTAGAELIIDPSGGPQEVLAVSAKSGNTLTVASITGVHVVGEYVAMISGVNTDSATSLFTRTAATTAAGSFKFTLTANGQASTAGTMSLTIITDKPVVEAAAATVSSTSPTPIPVLVSLVGADSTEVAATAAFTFTKLPTKGILGTPTTASCTNVALAKVGEVMTNCTSRVLYTPLLGATGNDTFDYVLTNGTETSVAAAVSIVLPGVTAPVAVVQGFAKDPVAGFNITTYNGGTVDQLGIDAAASGALSVAFTVGGKYVVYVVGAPAFVNQAVIDAFTGGIPAGEGVVIVV